MIVNFNDTDYTFNVEDMDLAEARHIKRQTGLTILGLLEGLRDLDPDALVALYWLMLKQNGQASDMNKVNFPVLKFGEAIGSAFDAESEANTAENPTQEAHEATPETA